MSVQKALITIKLIIWKETLKFTFSDVDYVSFKIHFIFALEYTFYVGHVYEKRSGHMFSGHPICYR